MIEIETTNQFGEWLKRYCNDHEIDVKTLSFTLGVGRRHVTHWIQGTSHPRLVNTVFLIEALHRLPREPTGNIYNKMKNHIMKDY